MHRVFKNLMKLRKFVKKISPLVNLAFQNCVEHSLLCFGIVLLNLADEIFHIFSASYPIVRTWIFHSGKLVFIFEADNITFWNINHRPNKCNINLFEIHFWRKGKKLTFVQKRKHHSFDKIIFVMSISDFVTAQRLRIICESPFTHFCTQ